ncbi:hypothetical protein ET495_12100 [Xylanimonas allomyrinae]|uniref:Uncharacterized protein n=1 Tax=Xylanimonas allomyrinae TaxID=2509459 RepID=A0A4P6EPV8_9MICO|nr:hypothetical protein [Xylanimonas allomyrinae]QAY63853.1 hypothetical protein ET495_12100 [Xylanimonas allomyrinae]
MSRPPHGTAPLADPTPEELQAARVWALEHDHEALLAHRVALLTQASWEVQSDAERHLVARHREHARTLVH